jgi:hypothetical protein
MYPELVYFDGAHFAHIVNFHEQARLQRLRSESRRSPRAPVPRHREANLVASPAYA